MKSRKYSVNESLKKLSSINIKTKKTPVEMKIESEEVFVEESLTKEEIDRLETSRKTPLLTKEQFLKKHPNLEDW